MRVLFVALGCEQLSIGLLAAVVRRTGHRVGLAFSRHLFDDRLFIRAPRLAGLFADDDVVEQATRFRPDVVCWSAITANYLWMIDAARRVKQATGAINVFGGVHPSAVPELVAGEPGVDFVCVGDGEIALPRLLEALAEGRADGPLPNMVRRTDDGRFVRGPMLPFVQDLDSLPHYEKDLWVDHIRLDSFYLTMSARGCPYRCTYCFNNFYATLAGPRARSGRYVRQRSVGHFLDELVEAKRRFRIRFVDIEDDIFTLDAGWMKEFARRYRREVGVPFRCLSHAHFLDDERVDALKEAGCAWVQLGVETADDEYKRTVKRADRQHHIEEALDRLERAGLEIKTDHIFGLPGEPKGAQQSALELYARHDIGRIGTFWLTYLPGTEIVAQGIAAGLLTAEEAAAIDRGRSTFFYREGNVADPDERRRLIAYEALFRALPLLPRPVRSRLDAERLARLPPSLVRIAGLAADTVAGLVRNNPELSNYRAQYAHGIENHLRWRIGLAPRRLFQGDDGGPLADPRWDRLYREALASAPDELPAARSAADGFGPPPAG